LSSVARAAVSAAVGAAVVLAVFLLRRDPPEPAPGPPPPPPPPSEVAVFYGRTPELEILFRRRFASPERARFADATLFAALGGDPSRGTPPECVELWAVRRSGDPTARLPAGAPRVALKDGRRAALRRLTEIGATPPPAGAGALLAALGPDATEPLGNSRLRRVVFGLPPGVAYEDVAAVEALGAACRRTLAAVESLDAWPENVPAPMASFLSPDPTARVAESPTTTVSPESRR
jgi:hypothetical protein